MIKRPSVRQALGHVIDALSSDSALASLVPVLALPGNALRGLISRRRVGVVMWRPCSLLRVRKPLPLAVPRRGYTNGSGWSAAWLRSPAESSGQSLRRASLLAPGVGDESRRLCCPWRYPEGPLPWVSWMSGVSCGVPVALLNSMAWLWVCLPHASACAPCQSSLSSCGASLLVHVLVVRPRPHVASGGVGADAPCT